MKKLEKVLGDVGCTYLGRRKSMVEIRCNDCGLDFFKSYDGINNAINKNRPVCPNCNNSVITCKEHGRFSGEKYENSPEKLAELAEKYRNGVPDGEIERWIMGL